MPEHCLIGDSPSWGCLGAFPSSSQAPYIWSNPRPKESARLSNVETLLHLIGREKVVLPQVGLSCSRSIENRQETGGFFGPWNFEVSR